MDLAKKNQLIAAGTDWDATIERFMNNEAMYEKFLHKFAKDQNFALLSASIDAGQNIDAEHAAHTLKGVAANLGFSALSDKLDDFIKKLRAGEDCQSLSGMFSEIKESYEKICAIIATLS